MKFKIGDVFASTCIFTGGKQTYKVIKRKGETLICEHKANEVDGIHKNQERFNICLDEGREYIVLWEYKGHSAKLYAQDIVEQDNVETRKVLITCGMSEDRMLILTDAPKDAIEQWARDYNASLEDGENIYLKPLQSVYYVKIVADSEVNDFDRDDIEAIGYDESYDLCDYTDWKIPESRVNSMCISCALFNRSCKGTENRAWTGCIYKVPPTTQRGDVRAVKFSAGCTGEYEIILTDAPDDVIIEHMKWLKAAEETGTEIGEPYYVLISKGYLATVIGCQVEPSGVEEDEVHFDKHFDYYTCKEITN